MVGEHSATSLESGERVILIAADTTVALDGGILGKPRDATEAYDMLRRLRGRSHMVYTGLVVSELNGRKTVEGVQATAVTMRPYSDAELEAYVASGEPLDKAGAYGIQHPVFSPVLSLEGCYLSVVGLSICHLAALLQQLAVPPHVDTAALLQAHRGYNCPLLVEVSSKQ